MTSRNLDLAIKRVKNQNELDFKYLLNEKKIKRRLVNHLNSQRVSLHSKTNIREKRFNNAEIRHEFMKLDRIITPKILREKTIDLQRNTYKHQNDLLNHNSKDNIYNYLNNSNYVFDRNEEDYLSYHKNMMKNMSFHNLHKKRYLAHIFDKFYNNNNDKKWINKDILFFLKRAVKDEIKEDKDYEEAKKFEKYMIYLKNKNKHILKNKRGFLNRLIEAKTRYNDYFLDMDNLLIQKVNKLRKGTEENFYHKKRKKLEDLSKKKIIEEDKRKSREKRMEKIKDEWKKKMEGILEKENIKFRFANLKENHTMFLGENARNESIKNKEDIENKAKEVQIRSDRILKNQTVYKKRVYEMPSFNFL